MLRAEKKGVVREVTCATSHIEGLVCVNRQKVGSFVSVPIRSGSQVRLWSIQPIAVRSFNKYSSKPFHNLWPETGSFTKRSLPLTTWRILAFHTRLHLPIPPPLVLVCVQNWKGRSGLGTRLSREAEVTWHELKNTTDTEKKRSMESRTISSFLEQWPPDLQNIE